MADQRTAPSRRQFLGTGLASAGLAGLGGLLGTEARAGREASALAGRPNFLVIMVDQQRYPPVYESADLAQFRKTRLKTQEAIRQNGVEFHRHYTASAACVPSRASFFTGHYPSLHGVTSTDGAAKDVHDPDMFWLDPSSVPTMGHYFRAAGYRTFYKGKWHVSHANLSVPGTRSSLVTYDENGERVPEKEALYLAAGRLEEYGFTGWIGPEPHGSSPLNSACSARGKKGRDEAIAGHMVELIDELEADPDDTPWFAYCGFLNPHDIALYGEFTRQNAGPDGKWDFSVGSDVPAQPFDASYARSREDDPSTKPTCQASYRETYPKVLQPLVDTDEYHRLYYELHRKVDDQMSRVYERLKRSRFFRNTVVVFTSDHGDLLGAHRLYQKWYNAYEETMHVPLLVSWPAVHDGPTSTDVLTSHVYLLPTLLGLAGLDADEIRRGLEGRFSDARPLVGKDLSAAVLGKVEPATLDSPVYFMTGDDLTRGLDQHTAQGLTYASVAQPCHVESVVARVGGKLWKYSRYFDDPAAWSEPGVRDEVALEIGNEEEPGTHVVEYRKTVKVEPVPDQLELYDLTADPMELENLAGVERWAWVEASLRELLQLQCAAKRLTPVSGTVPGQGSCG